MSDREAEAIVGGGEGSKGETSSEIAGEAEEVTLTAAIFLGLSWRSRWTDTLWLLCVGGCFVGEQRFRHQ